MKKMYIFLLLVVAGILVSFIWLARDIFTTENTLPVFRMSGETASYGELLLIRRLSPNGDILLKRLKETTVYQYDVRRKTSSEVGADVWNSTTEKISVCDRSFDESRTESAKYTSYGKYILASTDSPDKSMTAVLSAYGPKVKGFSLIFGGGYTIYGTRYLEIKRAAAENYKNIGKPIRVERMSTPHLCWTEDANSVVIYDAYGVYFSVADFNPQPTAAAAQEARTATEQSAPKPDLSRLTGVVSDYGVDENGDGLFEKIAIEVETETSLPAEYKIVVHLEPYTGKGFSEQTIAELKGGVERTRVLFETKPWFDEKIDGAFKITLIDLDYKNATLLDRREKLGETRAYKLSEFARPNIIFTGENLVTPIGGNRNGKYEGLKIQVGVDVLEAGDYEFQGDLYDGVSDTNEGFIEIVSDKTRLAKGRGTITFFFAGEKIARHAVSGKFRLRSVVVHKPGQSSPFVETLLTTEAFDANQFETGN